MNAIPGPIQYITITLKHFAMKGPTVFGVLEWSCVAPEKSFFCKLEFGSGRRHPPLPLPEFILYHIGFLFAFGFVCAFDFWPKSNTLFSVLACSSLLLVFLFFCSSSLFLLWSFFPFPFPCLADLIWAQLRPTQPKYVTSTAEVGVKVWRISLHRISLIYQ